MFSFKTVPVDLAEPPVVVVALVVRHLVTTVPAVAVADDTAVQSEVVFREGIVVAAVVLAVVASAVFEASASVGGHWSER
jgi:hypothetical protein